MIKKKGLGGCDAGPLKAEFRKLPAFLSATASQSQILEFQTEHLSRRFHLSPHLAATVASLAFGEARR